MLEKLSGSGSVCGRRNRVNLLSLIWLVFRTGLEVLQFLRTVKLDSLYPYSVEAGHSAHQVYTDPLKSIPPLCNPAIPMANPPTLHIPGLYGQFNMANAPSLHIFRPKHRRKPDRHRENVQSPHRQLPEAGVEPRFLA
eukprot:g28897.t1